MPRADALRNRVRLIEVAVEAFAAGGLGVPLDEIAKRAGVGPGTLYRHFPTREALFEAVVQERLQRLADAGRAHREIDDPADALFSYLELLVGEAAPKKDLADALTGAGIDVRARLAGTAAEVRAALQHLLSRAQQAGSVRPGITVADLMALLSGILHATCAAPGLGDADPRRALNVVLAGLRSGA